MNTVKSSMYLHLLLLIASMYLTSSKAESNKWLHYEPALVSLSGILDYEKHFGPPNYGEDKTDPVVMVPILRLTKPVNIRPETGNENNGYDINTDSFENIQSIQLVYSKKLPAKFSCITVSGTLMQAITGHHYTKVLLNVDKINSDKSIDCSL